MAPPPCDDAMDVDVDDYIFLETRLCMVRLVDEPLKKPGPLTKEAVAHRHDYDSGYCSSAQLEWKPQPMMSDVSGGSTSDSMKSTKGKEMDNHVEFIDTPEDLSLKTLERRERRERELQETVIQCGEGPSRI